MRVRARPEKSLESATECGKVDAGRAGERGARSEEREALRAKHCLTVYCPHESALRLNGFLTCGELRGVKWRRVFSSSHTKEPEYEDNRFAHLAWIGCPVVERRVR